MITIYSEKHRLHAPKGEIYGGELVTPFESPFRAELILEAVRDAGLGPVIEPKSFDLDAVLAVFLFAALIFASPVLYLWSGAGAPWYAPYVLWLLVIGLTAWAWRQRAQRD